MVSQAAVNPRQEGKFGGWNIDCAVRAVLKSVSDTCAEGAWLTDLSDFRLAVPFIGLHTAGGPSPHTEISIIEAAKDRVSGEASLFASTTERSWARTRLRTIVGCWIAKQVRTRDSFDQFVDDPFSISEWYRAVGKDSSPTRRNVVALKEEAGKTRLIISPPMDSYLRQAWLLSQFSDPPLNATFAGFSMDTIDWLNWRWYGAVDASKFDHNVPLWLITDVLLAIKEFAPWTASVVDTEIDYINNMYVEVYDERIQLVAVRCKEKLGRMDLQHVVQGDDILLFGTYPCQSEDVLKACQDIGMRVNSGKCLFGVAREFLKKICSPDAITSFPGRAIRAIFFANPWLETRQWDDARQISNVWHSLYARLLPLPTELVG
uniref:Reverse transcriptase domain-containing protein n=1 Tax=Trichuris muris TaxID=70415 RepID=A0A5S6QKU3_TRIMR